MYGDNSPLLFSTIFPIYHHNSNENALSHLKAWYAERKLGFLLLSDNGGCISFLPFEDIISHSHKAIMKDIKKGNTFGDIFANMFSIQLLQSGYTSDKYKIDCLFSEAALFISLKAKSDINDIFKNIHNLDNIVEKFIGGWRNTLKQNGRTVFDSFLLYDNIFDNIADCNKRLLQYNNQGFIIPIYKHNNYYYVIFALTQTIINFNKDNIPRDIQDSGYSAMLKYLCDKNLEAVYNEQYVLNKTEGLSSEYINKQREINRIKLHYSLKNKATANIINDLTKTTDKSYKYCRPHKTLSPTSNYLQLNCVMQKIFESLKERIRL